MRNSMNEEWIIPTTTPDSLVGFYLNYENFYSLLRLLENTNTLNEAQSAINSVYERELFLEKL